jgi:hypothetical protein
VKAIVFTLFQIASVARGTTPFRTQGDVVFDRRRPVFEKSPQALGSKDFLESRPQSRKATIFGPF